MSAGSHDSLPDASKIRIRDRIDHHKGFPAIRRCLNGLGDRARPGTHHWEGDEADAGTGLVAEPTAQIWIHHRGHRVVLHAAFGEKAVVDKKVPLVNRATIGRISRTDNDTASTEPLRKSVGDRANIAPRCGVERRAVFEQEPIASLRLQPLERVQCFRNRPRRRHRACFQGHHAGVEPYRSGTAIYDHAGPQSQPCDCSSHVAGTGKIIRYASQQHSHSLHTSAAGVVDIIIINSQ